MKDASEEIYDFEMIRNLKTEKKEYHSCFACNQLFPVKRMEQHHFPVPKRYEGIETIWLCLACHDFVDRITIGKWPDHFVENAVRAGREHKLLMLKLWSVFTDLKFGNKTTDESKNVYCKLIKEPKLNKYGIPECNECGYEMEHDETSGDWICTCCEISESDFEGKPHDLSLSHNQLWILSNVWLSMSKKQRLNFCIEYKVNDISERTMDAKAKAILAAKNT